MKRLLTLCCLLVLVACAPQVPATNEYLILMLQKQSTTDELATVRTKAALLINGVMEKEVEIFDDVGDLQLVDPGSYAERIPTHPAGKPFVVAVLTSWWAGGGQELMITQVQNPSSLLIERRYGDESGECTRWERVTMIPLPPGAQIGLSNFGEAVPQSNLAWCDGEEARE